MAPEIALVASADLPAEALGEETVDSLLYDYPVPRQFSRCVALGA